MHYHVGYDAAKGRSAVASQRLPAGTLLLSTSAYAAVSVVACNWCFAASPAALKRCGGCQQVKYCSRKCQQEDWTRSSHAKECAAWKQIPTGKVSQTVLLVARLAARLLEAEGEAENTKIPSRPLDTIEQLRHHDADHTSQKRAEFAEMAQLVVLMLSRSQFNGSAARSFDHLLAAYEREVVRLFCRVNCNAFTICDAVNAPVGIGMFPDAALLNHSCVPNCVVTFAAPRELEIHVITPVDAGDELTISYVELLESTARRQRGLRASYFFRCDCLRCVATAETAAADWFLEGFCCENASCRGPTSVVVVDDEGRAVCKACGSERDAAAIEAGVREVERLEKRVALADVAGQFAIHQEIWRLVHERVRCHPRSSRYATTARALGNFLIDHGDELQLRASDSALAFLERELAATQWVLPSLPLPSRGLLFFQLAKLSAATRRDAAAAYIQQALATLSVSYGSDHSMVLAAREFLRDLQLA